MAQLDDDVVDALADERSQQMLDGLDAGRITRQDGRVLQNAGDEVDARGNLDIEVGPPESDAMVGWRGLERERHLVPGMQSDPSTGNGSTKGPLKCHQPLDDEGGACPAVQWQETFPGTLTPRLFP